MLLVATACRHKVINNIVITDCERNRVEVSEQEFANCHIALLHKVAGITIYAISKWTNPSIHPFLHGLSACRCPMSNHFLTRWVFRLLGWLWYPRLSPVLRSIAFSLRLPYLDVFPFTLLHLPLNFTHVSSLWLMYLHPSVDPSFTHFLGEFPGYGLALVPDLVVPEAEQGCTWSRNLISNFCPCRGLNLAVWWPWTIPLDYGAPPKWTNSIIK